LAPQSLRIIASFPLRLRGSAVYLFTVFDAWGPKKMQNRGDAESQRINELTEAIIGAAIEVHKHLGPGLLESAYEACLCQELESRGLSYTRQVPLPVEYKGMKIDCGYRLDVVVENQVVLELKSVLEWHPVYDAQLLTYLKISGLKIGLGINFNVPLLKDGIHRKVLGL
jgi:GxxExxY protein